MTAVLYTQHYAQFFDNNGVPLSGGKLYTYGAGTTTPKPTYTTASGTIQNSNPIILDSAGKATLFLQGSYKFVLHDANDVPVSGGTTDNVTAFNATAEAADAFYQSFSGNGTQTAFTLSEALGTDEKTIMVYVDRGLQENVKNGNFATDTDWTKGAGWTISGGAASAATTISTALEQTSAVPIVQGMAYALTYTITSRTHGGLIPSIGGQAGVERTAAGTYREIIVAGSTQTIAFTGNGFTGTIDNVSITTADGRGFDIQPPSAYTLNGSTLTFAVPPATGTNNIQVWAPARLANEAAASAAAADASATAAAASQSSASTSATNAAASATSAANSAASLSGTSTTSLAIGTGAKVFTTQAGKAFNAGAWLLITSDANPANYMHGQVTAYSGASLTVDVTNIGGSGTLSDWTIRLSGTRGADGPAGGPTSDGNYVDVTVTSSGTVFTVNNGVISNAKLAAMPANTVKVNATGATGAPTDLTLGASTVLGRGPSGNAGALTVSSGLIVSGTELRVNPNRSYAEYTTYATLSAAIPYDDTPPQNTEGTQVLSATITPSSTTARIRARFSAMLGSNVSGANFPTIAAMFLNSGASAVQATACTYATSSGDVQAVTMEYEFVAGSTSLQTVAIRVGNVTGWNAYINGTSSARRFGGSARATLVLEEIVA